jgi:urease accessory protein
MPEHTIPFAGSRFRQEIDVQLRAGATLVLWDAIASGRIAHGERWRFRSLQNHIRVTMPSQATVCERYVLAPSKTNGGVGLADAWDYVGSLFIIGDAIPADRCASLESTLAEILDKHGDRGVLGGVSQPSVPGVVVKLVARSAPVMTRVVMELWAAVRQVLWQMPPAFLRKY